MQNVSIPDKDVPTANPDELIAQYTPLLYKIVNRYSSYMKQLAAIDEDDLMQAGRIAIYNAQKKFDPEGGASFLSFVFDRIRGAMRYTLGFKADGTLPEIPLSLDKLLTDEADTTHLDLIPDTAPTAEERIIDRETNQELSEAVHSAVDRLKSQKQREVIKRVWLDGQDRSAAAAEMGIKKPALCALDQNGRDKLRRDKELRLYATPFFQVGVSEFRSTWISSVEKTVIWREKHLFSDGIQKQ